MEGLIERFGVDPHREFRGLRDVRVADRGGIHGIGIEDIGRGHTAGLNDQRLRTIEVGTLPPSAVETEFIGMSDLQVGQLEAVADHTVIHGVEQCVDARAGGDVGCR